MPPQLLPSSAAAFSARAAPNIVLNTKVDPFLTSTLKRVARKRPLNSVAQHFRCLTELLSSPSAIWTLCTLFLQRAPSDELVKDDNPLVEAVFNFQMVSIEAYVVHVDMVSQNEVAFKLTSETIESLIEYHKDIHTVDAKNDTINWSEKDTQVKKLHEDFVQAINKFVYRTNSMVLDGLEEDGAGELLCGRADEVKTAIMGLFLPLLPPPPRPVDVVRPTPVLPSSTGSENWWQPTLPSNYSNAQDTWKYAPSEPVYTSADSGAGMWACMDMSDFQMQPDMIAEMSPTSTLSDPFSSESPSPTQFYSLPVTTTAMSSMPMPSTLMQQTCGPNTGFDGFGGFDWEQYSNFAPLQERSAARGLVALPALSMPRTPVDPIDPELDFGWIYTRDDGNIAHKYTASGMLNHIGSQDYY
ncbi:uncharacterized protein KY384_000965 [Bacidia gigantensis]|uniref:uncharacterized protein n=1 Tax=Bacidia gigantensis TaxID=2732470 RepID=UPI001D057463|nr:uncharacterized protein KY384_000965 [Bacidia gigantensis]KAG8534121.1 hypothetical protein KY384_000965 [Bacidia gigantensis]